MLKPAVDQALAELRETFAKHRIDVCEDGDGGSRVRVHDLLVGNQYSPSTSWVGFAITFQYPAADVYPHFVVGTFARTNGAPLGEGFQQSNWNGESVVQVSRRSNHRDLSTETAAIKLTKVLEWLRSR